jgi:hypothetical protein
MIHMTIKARIVLASNHGFETDNIALERYLGKQNASQDFCLLFDTPSIELDEFADALDTEYGAQSKNYARHVKQVKIHAYTPQFLMPQDERLKGYGGMGQREVSRPLSGFYVDKDNKLTFSDSFHFGGVFFHEDLANIILEKMSSLQSGLKAKGIQLELADETAVALNMR